MTTHDPLCQMWGHAGPCVGEIARVRAEEREARILMAEQIRADEQAKADLAISIWEQEYENERRKGEEERERLRAQVEALPIWIEWNEMWVRRVDVLALLDGESNG